MDRVELFAVAVFPAMCCTHAFLKTIVFGLLLIAPLRVNLPVGLRQGATIVHDLFTFGLLALLGGHLWLALTHPEARTALRTGEVDRAYAEREHPGWAADVTAVPAKPPG